MNNEEIKGKYIWGLLRLAMGWIFFWAFIDKLFGLGFATVAGKAWVNGVSPTFGFLKFATKGPFSEFFQGLAGNLAVDWIFMMGLLLLGLSLMLGIGMRIASYAGSLFLLLMYLAGSIPLANNPFLDEHLMYILLLLGLSCIESGKFLGFGKWWSNTELVKRFPILQ